MLRNLPIAILIITLTSIAGCDQKPQQAPKSAQVLQRAENYLAQGQFKAATIEVKNALKESSDNIDAYILLAKIYYQQGNYLLSIKVLSELPKDNLEVAIIKGQNFLQQGKFKSLDQALTPFKDNVEAKNSWEYQKLYTFNLILKPDIEVAKSQIKLLSALSTTQTQKAELEIVKSKLAYMQKDYAGQQAAIDRALAIEPGNVEALLEKSRIKLAAKLYEPAEDLLSQALMALPTTDSMTLIRMNILQALVATLSRQGRSIEAMVYSKLIAEANPKSQEIQAEFQSAIDEIKQGNLKKAEEILNKLYVTDNAKIAGSLLGMIHYQQGEFQDAAQIFDDTIDPETASPEMLRAYAESQLRLHNPEQALHTIEANVNNHPDDPELLSIYGLSLLATGDIKKGTETVLAALKADPSRFRLRLALANAYNVQNQPVLALEQLELAYQLAASDNLVQERLIKQYQILKKEPELNKLIGELEKSPSAQAKALAGLALLSRDITRANVVLDKAYNDEPSNPAVLRAQIARYLSAKDYANVMRFSKELVALDQDNLFALSSLTHSLIAENKKTEAVSYLKKMSQQSANSWGSEYVLAYLFLSDHDLEKASQHIDKALTRSGFNTVATQLYSTIYLQKAGMYVLSKRYADAREVILEALQNAPAHLPLMHLLMNIEIEQDNISAAEKITAEINQIAPGSHTAYLASADLAKAKGDDTAALLDYKNAWKIQATDRLGNILWASIQKQPAKDREAFLNEWEKRIPASFQVYTIRGLFQQELGNAKPAIAAYKHSLSINPKQPAALNNLAWLIFEMGDTASALAFATSAYELDPTNAAILDTYGWILFKNGEPAQALRILDDAVQKAPDNAEIIEHRAQVKAAL